MDWYKSIKSVLYNKKKNENKMASLRSSGQLITANNRTNNYMLFLPLLKK